MKKMKKLLCLALVFGLVFTSGIISFADDPVVGANEGLGLFGPNAPEGQYATVFTDARVPTWYAIDHDIFDGYYPSGELFIGTVESFLGSKADGYTSVFPGGFGMHPHDVLIMNDKVGIVLAAGSAEPWGYPGGAILDAGRVYPKGSDLRNADFGPNTVYSVQFLFNNWDAWSPANCGVVYFDLIDYCFETFTEGVSATSLPTVRVERKFAVPNLPDIPVRDLDVVSYYSIASGAEFAYMIDTVQNVGPAFSGASMNQVVLSNEGFSGIDTKIVDALQATNSYNRILDDNGEVSFQFNTTLLTPGPNAGSHRDTPFSGFSGLQGYREINFGNADTWASGEFRLFESYLLIDDQPCFQKLWDFWAGYNGLDSFNVYGSVTTPDDDIVPYPVVIVERRENGGSWALYGWGMGDANGSFSLDLPDEYNDAIEFRLKVEANGFAIGENSAAFNRLDALEGDPFDLMSGAELVPVVFNFVDDSTDDPVWGRVTFSGAAFSPTVLFAGRNWFFADNSASGTPIKGRVTTLVPPGITFEASVRGEGHGFLSHPVGTPIAAANAGAGTITGNTDNPGDREHTVRINREIEYFDEWFGTDNHHHGTLSDAFTPPEFVAKAQTVAGLDVLSLTDHDFVIDNWQVYQWAKKMNAVGYAPSSEASASWSHFNVFPLTTASYERFVDRNQENRAINVNYANVQYIFDEARQAGVAFGLTHPNSSYGLFRSDDLGAVPGGMSQDFDMIETHNSGTSGRLRNANPINETFAIWNAYLTGGKHRGVYIRTPKYMTAGSDQHFAHEDSRTGFWRSMVWVEGGRAKSSTDFDAFSLEFVRNFAQGHSYNSGGVFIEPVGADPKIFGKTYTANADGTFTAEFELSALTNITEIAVYSSLGVPEVTQVVVPGLPAPPPQNQTGLFPDGLTNFFYNVKGTPDTTRSFTLELDNVTDKQWVSIIAYADDGRWLITNPIWVVADDYDKVITAIDLRNPPAQVLAGQTIARPDTAVFTTSPNTGFNFSEWKLEGGGFGQVVKGGERYVMKFTAPEGWVFSKNLLTDANVSLEKDNTVLVYRVPVVAGEVKKAVTKPGDFISISETAKGSRVWALTFNATVSFTDKDGKVVGTEVVRYTIQLNGNNANLDGKYTFGADHDLAGFTLIYDIKGNGSNIKEFRIQ